MGKSSAGRTISDVAAAAGVSRASVSRAFTRPQMLSQATVRLILETAERIGYTPNQTARALSTGRHGNIALVVPDVANPFFPPLIRAAQGEAERGDLCVFLGNTNEDPAQEDKLVTRFIGQVEGLILASTRLSEDRIRAHAASRPLVLINRDIEGIPRVLIDSGLGVAAAVAHLAGEGHRHICYVSGPAASWSNRQRRQAVKRTAEDLGLTVSVVPGLVASFEAGRGTVANLLATGATAAIAFDDLMAQGIMAGLAERGIAVPAAFGIVGCDDVLGAATYPPLTTVANRSVEAGKAAMSLLSDLLASHAMRDARYVLETHLVIRGTTVGFRGGSLA